MTDEAKKIRPDFTDCHDTKDEKLTFFGVLNRFYLYDTKSGLGGISRNWKAESTRKANKNNYENVIFPRIPEKPLEEMTKEDFDEIVQDIIQTGGRGGRAYSAPRIQDFKRLLKGVTEEAAKQGVCEDVLFGSSYAIPESETRARSLEKELVRLRKSFTVKEEFLISQSVLRDPAQSGQQMGLALMFCMGIRNEEACGLDFGDIKPMQYHPQCSCLWVYKSTKRGSNQLQASGKTRNMARLLPIPGVLLKLLEERRSLLQEKVDAGQLVLPEDTTIEQLPIVCSDFDYLERCNSKQLTAAGRQMLKAVKVAEDELAYIDIELEENRLAEDGVYEKDPTVYLCRRNLGTHLYIMGLTEAEIQYIMGHDIEDPYENRNDFTNEDKLYQIKRIMELRPLVNTMGPPAVIELKADGAASVSFQNCSSQETHIVSDGPIHLKLQAVARVPQNDIHIDVSYKNSALQSGELCSLTGPAAPINRTVNITQEYHRVYKSTLNKIKTAEKDRPASDLEEVDS